MEQKSNILIIDGRHSLFKKREKIGNLKNKEDISEILKNSQPDEQSLKHIYSIQNEFKFYILLPTKSQAKISFYQSLRKEYPNLFDLSSSKSVYFQDLLIQDLEKEISNILEKENQNSSIESVSIISHNLFKFKYNFANVNYPVYKILMSCFSQEYNKRRNLECESYAQNLVDYHASNLFQLPSAVKFLLKLQEQQQNEETLQKIYNIGYFFDYSKQSQMNNYNITNANYPYKFTPLDFRLPYEGDIPPYGKDKNDNKTVSLMIHKFQDIYKDKTEKGQQLIQQQESNFQNFIQKFKSQLIIIDDTLKQDKIRSRVDFDNEFQNLLNSEQAKQILSKYPSHFISTPKIFPFDPKIQDIEEFISRVEKQAIFPIIVKTVVATCSKESHFMALVHNINSLKKFLLDSPLAGWSVIIQEMINHDNRINKIYVIGNHTEIQARVSIPNIDVEQYKDKDDAVWTFDSQKGFKEQLPIQVPDKLENPNSTLHKDLIQDLSKLIRDYFNLNIFGYDIVQRTGTQEYYIVDINYFPGFKNFNDVNGKFLKLYQDLISKSQYEQQQN
ncbi:inositol 1, 3, 4-trisphosphate 5/6-kinase (macronuclear) [Tetrahymena thermophila SB210]|uniref:inositol-1,3,4-trisphosphate 5/6-kinase n=1 Tax=Tetrahymena thermophila (strain SB210) TaxID=312017 RepID=I7MGE3_TETTS|nr:inositol 1, 3, 4-trisphosphate 5/6-kinase [Tetrahymena thermophila SB210]EAR85078.1 inositol 1, 3, 4-trisphosphate 5/6-kinase [Tetrahymena thermophila SB210]|eukprot:XP_001032741.1 inositol 1, 3, 4-trisphosphate 5/6-kinase [Tetrahymena thermophila SB210]